MVQNGTLKEQAVSSYEPWGKLCQQNTCTRPVFLGEFIHTVSLRLIELQSKMPCNNYILLLNINLIKPKHEVSKASYGRIHILEKLFNYLNQIESCKLEVIVAPVLICNKGFCFLSRLYYKTGAQHAANIFTRSYRWRTTLKLQVQIWEYGGSLL